MLSTTTTRKTLTQTLTLIPKSTNQPHRNYAKWTPYKPSPKPKHHQKLLQIKTLQSHLESSYLVSPFPCHGFSANSFKPLKSPIPNDPSSAKIIVVKNTLVSKALAGTHWAQLGPTLKGMNSLMFVKREEIVGQSISGVRAKVKEGKMEFNEFSGALVKGGQVYGHLDLEVLEKMPSRDVANGMLLGSLFGPSSTLMAVLEGIGAEEEGEDGDGGAEKAGGGSEDQA